MNLIFVLVLFLSITLIIIIIIILIFIEIVKSSNEIIEIENNTNIISQ